MSARQLGEAHEKDLEKDETALTDEARWEEIGAEIKEKIHASMVYAFMPEHLRAVYRVQFGAPGQEEEDTAVPLRGVRPETAQTVMRVKESGAWKEKPWAQSEFWRQWREEGAKARLRATARLARDEEF